MCFSSSSDFPKKVKPRKCVSSMGADPLAGCDPTASTGYAVRVLLNLADLPLKRIVATCSCLPPELADEKSALRLCITKDSSRRFFIQVGVAYRELDKSGL